MGIVVEYYYLCLIVELQFIEGIVFVKGYVVDIKILWIDFFCIGGNVNIVGVQVQVF